MGDLPLYFLCVESSVKKSDTYPALDERLTLNVRRIGVTGNFVIQEQHSDTEKTKPAGANAGGLLLHAGLEEPGKCSGISCLTLFYSSVACADRYSATPAVEAFMPALPLFQPAGQTSPCSSVNCRAANEPEMKLL